MIENSVYGLTFTEMERIRATGNSTERVRYKIEDEKPQAGKSYYKLKQTDEDGTVVTYGIVLVDFDGLQNSIVYPNPVRTGTELKVELNFDPKHPLEVALYDLSGRMLDRVFLKESSLTLPINLNKGFYLLRITSPEYQEISRFSVSE